MTETELIISPRLRKVLRRHTPEEYTQLEKNIIAEERVTDPVLFWNDGKENVIVDGMTRWEIAKEHNIPCRTEPVMAGKTYEEVKEWMRDRQAGRRNMSREEIGEWYNELKGRRGGDPKSKVSNDTLAEGDAAKRLAAKTGKSPATIKRAGQRVKTLERCTPTVQKGVETKAIKLTDADVQTLSELAPGNQDKVAAKLRKGAATSVEQAMEQCDIRPPAKPRKAKKAKPPKKLDRGAYFKQWDKAIGPLVRLVDKIAAGVGEEKSKAHQAVQRHLNDATKAMMAWMEVKE